MFSQKNWLVVLVSAQSIQLAGLGSDSVQTIPLPQTVSFNMEIINKDGLYTIITDWLKQHTYTNTAIIWLLAPDICFEYLLTSSEQAKIDSETLQFLDSVPFENITSRIYSTAEGRVITAVNQDFIQAFIQGFSLHGYSTKAVIPARLVQVDATLTPEISNQVIKHVADLTRESLIAVSPPPASPVPPPAPPSSSPASPPPVTKPTSTLPILLVIFAVLLAILLYVILLNR
ncbi:MAG: hypothetical protein UX38_C0022G0004 [Microgenomates group bacterium GW2011_GWC1_46_16]|jgi:hypothetical protein|uniref:Uncharacterized protein n=2 Tax=Candidatus Collieribacteriota TaxID=1752725 RepID=A0A1F5FZB4_9BACT|nr:MAG: hypothetical protein UX32_C0010G0010 [Microgenomates group bacterium GW2011_GWF1_46_12]KKU25553.1 MAG: hypothetical protein UX38_C0022G0004 [Microgenomates group bacterium GW2011_GWC1_46_16]KKU27474.1 MAG: hypothetical protein UX40_C0014G0009 [Microgenomates group bacterium GW2011_GWF2_46_18]KKU60407.1 MAG: hypothetical protein UX82_C0012G0009 [Microgenomates group bacterium GW2011_GWE1_47_12]KKU62552.1 MAG: hypothetical protein UX84_C0005G0033 [Microgenomates group bacterium GW2011_GWD